MRPQSDVALAPLSTMGVGGAARYFVSAATEFEVCDALHWAGAHSTPVHVLGGGSNVVIADDGVDGLVVHLNIRGVEESGSRQCTYRVGAGETWDAFVASTVAADCSGLECLSGIPGSVGGTPVQNVGAYGQDVSATITRVHAVNRATTATETFLNRECGFGYRTSRFKHADAGRYIVTAVEFELARGGRPTIEYADVVAYVEAANIAQPTLQDAREAVLAIRRRKGMVIEPGNAANRSCGSFFVNPLVTPADLGRVRSAAGDDSVPFYRVDAATVKIPAAWLVERAGFPKGTTRGPVGISPFQAQAIINRGGASSADVLALAADVKRAVWNVFGISIVPEPVFLGFPPSPEFRFLLTHQRSD